MSYSNEQIDRLYLGFVEAKQNYVTVLITLNQLIGSLSSNDAREYLWHGAGRRLRILRKCAENIFSIYRPERRDPLADEQLVQISIELHAFYVNLFGIFDNLAWVLAFEKKLDQKINRQRIGLYEYIRSEKKYAANQTILSQDFCSYLNSTHISTWHNKHLKEYRDSLAHRIPLYLPPGVTPEGEDAACPFFAGSINKSKEILMHPQLLANLNTVYEIVSKFIECEFPAFRPLMTV